ncbi:lariat debranching enzyme [Savitreella phatthalungensis]
MHVAVEGCCHGELDAIYAALAERERQMGVRVDLLLIAGDFQACRTEADLECMAVPLKYRRMADFAAYHRGDKLAPVLTIFVGGNHEASNHLQQLPHGGWVAPRIWYMGNAGVVCFRGLRIAGISGIYDHRDYRRGRHERPPYTPSSLRSVYHTREYDVVRMSLYTGPRIDVCISHDWPRGIYHHGNKKELLKRKPYFRDEINRNDLGSPANELLLKRLRPRRWLSAHLHVKFEALVRHEAMPEKSRKKAASDTVHGDGGAQTRARLNPDEIEITLDSSSEDGEAPTTIETKQPPSTASEHSELEAYRQQALARLASQDKTEDAIETRFLALDKCLPRRQFLEILNFDHIPESPTSDAGDSHGLSYDPDWLAVVRAMHQYFSTGAYQRRLPDEQVLAEAVAAERRWVEENVLSLSIPANFTSDVEAVKLDSNSQTAAFCAMLDIPHPWSTAG